MKIHGAILVAILMGSLVAGAAVAGQEERSEQLEFEDEYLNDGD